MSTQRNFKFTYRRSNTVEGQQSTKSAKHQLENDLLQIKYLVYQSFATIYNEVHT